MIRRSRNAAVLAYERSSTHRERRRRTFILNLFASALVLGSIWAAACVIYYGGGL